MDGSTLTVNVFAAIGGIIAAFLAGGGLSLVALNVVVGKLNSDVATQNAIEALATSLPPSALGEIRSIIKLVQDGSKLADKVTDGLPNTTVTAAGSATVTVSPDTTTSSFGPTEGYIPADGDKADG